ELVVAGRLTEEAIESILDAGLAGYAVERLAGTATRQAGTVPDPAAGSAHPLVADPRIKRGRLLLAARHATLRRAVVELLDAWRQAGIETLLVKGFYLAEFVYPDPSMRLYSDIDLALRSSDAEPLTDLAAR